ncbi:hypothetical protein [Amycolatopsis sp. CA-230715]|uniref:hypothetical protein n=1 Tax=Amycolatopsis sp. CA-230715 TaxID=2745196 RepID=UPI001C334626|nr:hypothetical protein [Amycolatopsis sp. CA-230715]QWF81056.1 hypothetical protein HUW46_04481 [Amycolatopsis sp. CA-230715]
MATARAPRGHDAAPGDAGPVDWGEYAAAVHRWELITGRPAPYPTQPGRHGRPVLAPPFVEWLMGLPPGWVTAEHLDLPRTAQLRALGNGVMPAQARHAVTLLLDDLTALAHTQPGCRQTDPSSNHRQQRHTANRARREHATSTERPRRPATKVRPAARTRPARSAPARPTTG